MWTKQQLVEKAFLVIGLASYTYDIPPELMEAALQDLDTMMASWASKGINLGYLLPAIPDDSNLDDASGIPDDAVEPVYMNLAVKLAPGRGKTLAAETKLSAKQGFDRLLGVAARAAARQVPMPNTMPRGAGNKPWRGCSPFFPGAADTLDVAGGGDAITTS
ncbi:packaged DNA stabilization gp4 family protein [Massilia phyllosphaerae]|uniref:packaged DNA stabilization gp4 family protein n=1 Tax=Massilia phyllosphaerae TaxID=3106034 RepID=UPI002B1CC24C|nr:packaged DNA stabilization gp4 family protein [Massilia sp. SGZ-792]